MVFVACSGHDEVRVVDRTIMVYFNSENNIGSKAKDDLAEIVEGSMEVPEDVSIIVFLDDVSAKKSYLYRVSGGEKELVNDFGDTNLDASSPENILKVFRMMMSICPAKEYVTVFWGHGTGGWITDLVSSRAYGADFNEGDATDATWINIPEMADVLEQLPKQKMIMFDACLMQSIEVAYELKDCADYIVGCTCETPDFGANFTTLIPILATAGETTLPKAVIDDYTGPNNKWSSYKYQFTNVAMSAVKTSELDNLLSVTKSALDTLHTEYLATSFPADAHGATKCIFYYRENDGLDGATSKAPLFHDLKDVMRHNLSTDDFSTWCQALDRAVIYKNSSVLKNIDIRTTGIKDWIAVNSMQVSDFYSFYVDDETCGALSMFIPDSSLRKMNTLRLKYQWWQKISE